MHIAVYLGAFRGDSSHSGLVMGIARAFLAQKSLHRYTPSHSASRISLFPLVQGASLRPFTFTHRTELCAGACRLQPYVFATRERKHSCTYLWIIGLSDFKMCRFFSFPFGTFKIFLTFLFRKLSVLCDSRFFKHQRLLQSWSWIFSFYIRWRI